MQGRAKPVRLVRIDDDAITRNMGKPGVTADG
jgi:hypothetical protein